MALALKTLGGFDTVEIAKAFLTTEASIAKRLTRAKRRLRDDGIPFEIPEGAELSARLEAVLHTLYLLFNEGYKASGGERLVREELCSEAIRLMTFLVGHPAGDVPRVHALLALMFLNARGCGGKSGASRRAGSRAVERGDDWPRDAAFKPVRDGRCAERKGNDTDPVTLRYNLAGTLDTRVFEFAQM